jgi:hypothetical protein
MIAPRATRRAALGLVCGLVALGAAGRDAGAARFALLVGNNEGRGGDARLRFAESDATRLADVLKRLGGFSPATTLVQLGGTAGEVRRALGALADLLRATPGEHLVLVYYSGHADAQELHLGSSSLTLAELREAVTVLPAATRVLILDACQAGALTRAKGGKPGRGFDVGLGAAGEPAQGLAVLASSAGSELAQESDDLGGSVFTHYLQVGLSGLADRNRDGNVSLGEVFDYTSDHTLAATLGTAMGPQHPTFRLDLTGRDDLVLTQPGLRGVGYGHLRLDVPGWYFIRRGDGTIAVEVVSHGDDTLALEPGRYEVTRREPSRLLVADVSVDEGGGAAVSAAPSRVVSFGRMVRKGGGPSAAYGLAATSAARTPLEDLGPSLGAGLIGRVDLSAASLELRLGLGRARHDGERLSSTTWDLSAAVAVLRMRDAGGRAGGRGPGVTWGFGIEAGAAYLAELVDDGRRLATVSPFAGPVALAEMALGGARRYFLRAGVGVPVYLLRTQAADQPSAGATTRFQPALEASLGGGASF